MIPEPSNAFDGQRESGSVTRRLQPPVMNAKDTDVFHPLMVVGRKVGVSQGSCSHLL